MEGILSVNTRLWGGGCKEYIGGKITKWHIGRNVNCQLCVVKLRTSLKKLHPKANFAQTALFVIKHRQDDTLLLRLVFLSVSVSISPVFADK